MAITRLLIANRGEIACRIARTAHDLGISTVGVYSDPDARARHVDAVDVAVALGGSSPSESYLRIDALLDAARQTGCDAVHPGYGFLSENADFAEAVLAAGLTWVGPRPDQIALLGDKVAAKEAAAAAGVPTSSTVTVQDGELSEAVSYPALVKAAAGGGGRGMRVVESVDDMAGALAAASREAEAAFGDGTVFIEPYLPRGRHLEVQIFGDVHGTVIHLGERECSIQRRNQKIVEEAPAAAIHPAMVSSLHEWAVALGEHVGYVGAGTVEFLVDDDRVVFLEVNTRLQVEHPVTEAVTGLDLVALQFAVANGEPLPITQEDVTFDGHAIEVRLVAERPAAGWVPASGTLTDVTFDSARTGARVETGFATGDVVSSEYDSLLAKVIVHGPTRRVAAARLGRALRSSAVAGVATNLAALTSIVEHPAFLAAHTQIGFLDEHPEVRTALVPDGDDRRALIIAAVLRRAIDARGSDSVTGFAPANWRNLATVGARERWHDLGAEAEVCIESAVHSEHRFHDVDGRHGGLGALEVRVGPWPEPTEEGTLPADERTIQTVAIHAVVDGDVTFSLDGVRRVCSTSVHGDGSVTVGSRRGSGTFVPIPRFVIPDEAASGSGPVSPLPGTVLSVHVEVGQHVEDGDLLVVVEAMKMEHSIRATSAGVVAEVPYGVGDRVDAGSLLVLLELTSADP